MPSAASCASRTVPRRLAVLVCALIALACAPVASAEPMDVNALVYWVNYDNGHVGSARLDGSAATSLVVPGGRWTDLFGAGVDAARDRLYFGAYSTKQIWTSTLDGQGARVLYENGQAGVVLQDVEQLVADTTGSDAQLYIVDWGSGTPSSQATSVVRTARVAAGATPADDVPNAPTVLLNAGALADGVQSIAVDSDRQRLYWAGFSGAIHWAAIADLGGNAASDAVHTTNVSTAACGSPAVEGIAVGQDDSVYLLPAGGVTGPLKRLAADGSSCTTVATLVGSQSAPRTLSVNARDGKILYPGFNLLAYADLDAPSDTGTLSTAAGAVQNASGVSVVSSPMAATATALSGSATVGATLTCAPATWAADFAGLAINRAPRTTALAWRRDGQTVVGATGTTLVVSQAGSYTCVSTATNVAGATESVSSAVATPRASEDGASAAASPSSVGSAVSATPTLRLRGDSTQDGAALLTPVELTGPGVLAQTGWVTVGKRKVRACSVRKKMRRGGRVVLRCKVSRRVLRLAARGAGGQASTPVELRTSFTPTGGPSTSVTSSVVMRDVPGGASRAMLRRR